MSYIVKEENGFKYIEEGEGDTLLLLHGLFGALSNWEDVTEAFKSQYRVVIPLLPIYELPLLTTGVTTLAKFLLRFVRHKQLKNINLLGNSLGGHVALIFTLSNPEYVKALVLTGSSGLYENSFGGSFPRRESYDFIQEKVAFTFYDPAMATKELVDEVFAAVNDRNKVIRILSMAKSAIRHNMAKDLHKITIPVCLIWGKDDKVTPPEVAEEFYHLLPNSELNWVDKCGHAPMMERPAEFIEYLQKFLDRVLLK
ncbi:pimeloyl-ACP methyl ester carboxylesterase [Arcticibacter tournemirensis]|uniref:Alpha/beta hydrolase n=1 Tax=Arcticibacter tournemirensis TaxID=699437 RepID=A0A4Q0M2E0_9SPHI|nr:alpha/beta hydrolase [Arcticibacter tournemirensis]KAA8475891.1 alpha/beta hydrolase [Arcticibacter tournemirensis]RXF66997.1 alpha/beta hydrolase [Arcticibacter tournemirensis]TQM51524.1 pimeloyl-ACP methyl ester carboxylesterase [Arcticibacter tournemirensis]